MDEMKPLSMDEMEQVSAGAAKRIRVKTADVRSGPSFEYPVIATLSSGVTVNYMGRVVNSKEDGGCWYWINKPANGWINEKDLGVV